MVATELSPPTSLRSFRTSVTTRPTLSESSSLSDRFVTSTDRSPWLTASAEAATAPR